MHKPTIAAIAAACLSSTAIGQAPSAPDPATPDPVTIALPKLDFVATPQDEDDFDKYYYFHREATGFAEAYADIGECDALSSGRPIYVDRTVVYTHQNTTYGLIGSAIGNVIGSVIDNAMRAAATRKLRRINMRNCMGFKGYQRYGISKDLWQAFNFEEGYGRKAEELRETALRQQARVASGAKPQQKALSL
jgi:hypothetical protein